MDSEYIIHQPINPSNHLSHSRNHDYSSSLSVSRYKQTGLSPEALAVVLRVKQQQQSSSTISSNARLPNQSALRYVFSFDSIHAVHVPHGLRLRHLSRFDLDSGENPLSPMRNTGKLTAFRLGCCQCLEAPIRDIAEARTGDYERCKPGFHSIDICFAERARSTEP